jgi:hypothetical protein
MRTSQRMRVLASCPLALLALGLAAAQAADSDPARVRVSAGLLDEMVQGLLPTMVRLPPLAGEPSADNRPTLATLTELKYCGATDRGAGRFRALLRLEASAGPVVSLLGKDGCKGGLADVAKRVGEGNEAAGITVVDLEATWKPWEVRLVVVRAEGTTKISKARLATGLEKRRELLVVPTGDTRIQTESGPLALYAVPSFLPGVVEIAVVLGGSGAPGSPEKLAANGRSTGITGEANVAAELPLSFANQLLRRLTWTQPLIIPVNQDEVELRNVSISGEGAGEGARVTLTGNATPSSIRETMRWTAATSGDPMKIALVKIAAQMEDCSGLATMAAVGCNVRNGARSAAAEAFASSLTQRYQGLLVHELSSPQTLRFSVAGERFILSGDLLRMALGLRGISAMAKLTPPQP